MRYSVAILLLGAVTTPALAARHHGEDAEAAHVAERLNDPAMQSAVSGMMLAMSDAFMDLRVDRLRAAIARVDPDLRDDDADWDQPRTVGDMIARDDPYYREHLARDSRRAVGTMGAMASGMAEMVPELRAMGDRMGRDIDRAMRRMPR